MAVPPTPAPIPAPILAPPLAAGFADPVLGAQAAFRAVLAAMAEPARPVVIPAPEAPQGANGGAAALLLTLADADTPVSAPETLREWLAFHAGVPLVPRGEARFVACDLTALPPLADLLQGEPDYPDRSATVVAQVDAFDGRGLAFDGPGFDAPRTLHAPWPDDFEAAWAANDAFPLGVDLVLASPTHVAGLPRTARIVPPTDTKGA